MDKCLKKNAEIIQGIPSSVVSKVLKKSFIRSRAALLQRAVITESKNKIESEWTLPRMLAIAKEEEENEKAYQKKVKNILDKQANDQ